MTRAVGIAFGTTTSAVAAVTDSGHPEILSSRAGGRSTRSVVHFREDGSTVVGDSDSPDQAEALETVECIKRHMGSTSWRYDTASGVSHTPESIAALILAQLRRDAEQALGEHVTDAVIAVPAYFDDAQRWAFREAGRIAGLNVVRLINEPTAAALSLGSNLPDDGTVLIFDLGGGSLDLTVLSIWQGVLDVLGTGGLPELGGTAWDERLLHWVHGEWLRQNGIELLGRRAANSVLAREAEAAKKALTATETTEVELLQDGASHRIAVTREHFENLTADLLDQVRNATLVLIGELGLTWLSFSEIFLVGGAAQMPAISQMLEDASGIRPRLLVNPGEAVALGAAVQAHIETTHLDDEADTAGEAEQQAATNATDPRRASAGGGDFSTATDQGATGKFPELESHDGRRTQLNTKAGATHRTLGAFAADMRKLQDAGGAPSSATTSSPIASPNRSDWPGRSLAGINDPAPRTVIEHEAQRSGSSVHELRRLVEQHPHSDRHKNEFAAAAYWSVLHTWSSASNGGYLITSERQIEHTRLLVTECLDMGVPHAELRASLCELLAAADRAEASEWEGNPKFGGYFVASLIALVLFAMGTVGTIFLALLTLGIAIFVFFTRHQRRPRWELQSRHPEITRFGI